MTKKSKRLKILGLIFSIIVLAGGCFLWAKIRPAESFILGAHAESDPNHPVEVYFGDSKFTDLKSMAKGLAIDIFPEDRITAFPPPEMGLGSQLTIIRATPVEVTDAKKTMIYRTWTKNIKELLAEQHIELLGKDSVDPAENISVERNMKIKITRVAEIEITQKEDIEFKTIKKENHAMERGQSTVEQKGQKGQKEVIYIVKRVDGEEVSRKVKSTDIIKEPVTETTIVGTGPRLVHSGPFVDLLNAAAKKYDVNATGLQCLMIRESNGHTDSVAAAGYVGLFQYDPGFWPSASSAAGFSGAEWTNAEAQIFTTARLISIGQSRRWPPYASCANK